MRVISLAALAVTADPAAAQGIPFAGLHAPPEVITSTSAEAVWFDVTPLAYAVRLPEAFQNRHKSAGDPWDPPYDPAIRVHCRRSSPESVELGFRSGTYVEVVIPRLADEPTASLVFSPLFWLYELTGQAVLEVPMRATVNGGAPEPVSLRIHRTDYSASRPQLYARLPIRGVLESIAGGQAWTIEAIGEEAAFRLEIPAGTEAVRRAAQRVLNVCSA